MQSAFHWRSLCLYNTVGFRTPETPSVVNALPPKRTIGVYHVRAAEPSDLDAPGVSRFDVYGFERGGGLTDAIEQKTTTVVSATVGLPVIGFFAHGVARNNCDLIALIPASGVCIYTGAPAVGVEPTAH